MNNHSTSRQMQLHSTTTRNESGTTNPQGRYEGGNGITLVGGMLIALAGTLTLMAVTTPIFILSSPVIVSTTIVIGLYMTEFLTYRACGVTALTLFSWVTAERNFFLDCIPFKP
ncbi:hypothetical protein TanjilG_20989 [Lupinus angustifolius]|uniref:Oleosin n=1 Tax=Lupinus angustifolius TaxID=3871 RepID=A0A1J7H973_LUPAN|nr:PREDICTED: P24 oleosin-like [Lupinus angustifolius]OIW09392.1 hypothetical protein TanjilG_20989 [Lupinus angustifolius]